MLVVLKQESARCLSGEDAVKTSKVQADEGVPEPSLASRSYGGGGDFLFHFCCASSCSFSGVISEYSVSPLGIELVEVM